MRYFINESKRDDLLLSYYNQIVANGINISFGQFKSKLLNTLASSGGMHNLSLRSNYYLAGAARYYFNGDLTTNKDVAMANPDYWVENSNVSDSWNDEVCKRLDALINVLRNAYIDSVGTTFEQPEDFGTLPIKKLLRKYNSVINKELGIKPEPKQRKTEEIDTNPNVGNNYTFEIMYSFEDCQKYERPTAPGSWCITYGEGHYNYYKRALGIHYVIFRMNGWEDVQRPEDPRNDPNWSSEKPHDLYGNSLIALLQSNSNPEPVYITSRWNHGANGISCEADHAYTKEEFQQITGVTDDDLNRIYKIWKENKPVESSRSGGAAAAQTRAEAKLALREIKYTQMRINAGENPNVLLRCVQRITNFNGSSDTFDIKKNLCFCRLRPEDGENEHNTDLSKFNYTFLVDRGKIIFETINKSYYCDASGNGKSPLIFLKMNLDNTEAHYVYNTKRHSLLTIDGKSKFLSTPGYISEGCQYFTVNRSTRDFAIVNAISCEPLRLPNGEYWCNKVSRGQYDWRAQRGKNGGRWFQRGEILNITYDESSGESYYFDTYYNRFIPESLFEHEGSNNYPPRVDESNDTNYIEIRLFPSEQPMIKFICDRQTLKKIDFGLGSGISDIQSLGNALFAFTPTGQGESYENDASYSYVYLGDAKTNKPITYNDGFPIKFLSDRDYRLCTSDKYLKLNVTIKRFERPRREYDYGCSYGLDVYCRLFDKETKQLVINPFAENGNDNTIFNYQLENGWYNSGLYDGKSFTWLLIKNGIRLRRVEIQDLIDNPESIEAKLYNNDD